MKKARQKPANSDSREKRPLDAGRVMAVVLNCNIYALLLYWEFVQVCWILTPTCPKLTRPGCDKSPGCPMAALRSTLSTRHAVIDENNWTASAPHICISFIIATSQWQKNNYLTWATSSSVICVTSCQRTSAQGCGSSSPYTKPPSHLNLVNCCTTVR